MTERSPHRPLRRLLLLQVALWPALLVAAELGHRGYLALRGESYDRAELEVELRRVVSGMTRDMPDTAGDRSRAPRSASSGAAPATLHPYVGFGPGSLVEKTLRELRLYSAPRAPDELRILIVGGSVAGNFGRKGTTALARALAELPEFADRRFVWINYGLGAHKQPQQLLLVNYLLSQGLEVDALLNLDGFNEVALSAYNAEHGAHPSFPSMSHWGHLSRPRRDDPRLTDLVDRVSTAQSRATAWSERVERGAAASSLLGTWALTAVRREHAAYARAYEEYADLLAQDAEPNAARAPALDNAEALRVAVDTWRRSSQLLSDLARSHEMAYLHVLQPTLHDAGAKPVSAEEAASGDAHASWLRGAREGYPALRAAGVQLTEEGVPFLDASRVFADVEETLYYDVCHFHEPGHRRLARVIAPALARELAGER